MTAALQSQQQQQQLPPAVQYREILQECDQLARKIAELEVDRNEHILVEETLKPLEGSRRAYRLVGDVLVERSVKEVLPSVTSNKENVSMHYHSFGRKQWKMISLDFVFSRFICPFFLEKLLAGGYDQSITRSAWMEAKGRCGTQSKAQPWIGLSSVCQSSLFTACVRRVERMKNSINIFWNCYLDVHLLPTCGGKTVSLWVFRMILCCLTWDYSDIPRRPEYLVGKVYSSFSSNLPHQVRENLISWPVWFLSCRNSSNMKTFSSIEHVKSLTPERC